MASANPTASSRRPDHPLLSPPFRAGSPGGLTLNPTHSYPALPVPPPWSFTPLPRQIGRGIFALRPCLKKVSCQFCARSAAIAVFSAFCLQFLGLQLIDLRALPDASYPG